MGDKLIKEYTCQSCGDTDTDKDRFKLLSVLDNGWVICKRCIMDWGD